MFITHIYVLKDYYVEIVWDCEFFGMEEMIYCDEHWHGYGAVGWRILTDLFSFLFMFLFILEEFRKRSSISTIFIRIITRIHLWLSHTNEKTR